MPTMFEQGTPQGIPQVLANKDERAALQRQLVIQNPGATIVAAKLNIPGPIKSNALIERVFEAGMAEWQQRLRQADLTVSTLAQWRRPTGPEQFDQVFGRAADVKRLTVSFEDQFALGRLFDLDVLQVRARQVVPLSRADFELPARTCFVCGRPAKACARSRRHSVLELQTVIEQRVQAYFVEEEHDHA